MRSLQMRSLAWCLGIILLVVACSTAANVSGIRAEDREHDFLLVISAPQQVWTAGAPIEVSSELSYLGPGSRQVWGPGPGGHIGFDLTELTGNRRLQWLWLLACVSWSLTRAPIREDFHKGSDAGQDDPANAFTSDFLDDPLLRLPPGRWEVTAVAPFSFGPRGCGGTRVDLQASITLIVR